MMSFYNTNLSFRIGQSNKKPIYDARNNDDKGLSTSINYEGAALLCLAATPIINGENSDKEIKVVVQCNNATLTLDYQADQNNQMTAFLTINKFNQSASFKFATHTHQIKENGQFVTKIIQSGLGVLIKTIESYLLGTGIDIHLKKLPETPDLIQDEDQQPSHTKGNNSGLQNGNFNGNQNGYQNQNYNGYGPR